MKLKVCLIEDQFCLKHIKSGLYYNGTSDKSHVMQRVMNDYLEAWGQGFPTEEQSLKNFVPLSELGSTLEGENEDDQRSDVPCPEAILTDGTGVPVLPEESTDQEGTELSPSDSAA